MCSIGKLEQIIYLTSNEWRHFLKSLPVILLLNIKSEFFHFLFSLLSLKLTLLECERELLQSKLQTMCLAQLI